MARDSAWDTELYEAQHSFVWRYGEVLVSALNPQPGERILDLGCGTGQLTHSISEAGAEVLGLDASPDMIGQARQNFPRLQFKLGSAVTMSFESEFDAVFSNAALHWIPEAGAVVSNISAALRPGGRFIAEFGGKGNIKRIEEAVQEVLVEYLGEDCPRSRFYFPALGEYASLLEQGGLEVRSAASFDRPTPLEGARGMEQWIRQFAFFYFEPLPSTQQSQAISRVIERLRPQLYKDNVWTADYRRLRILASKV